MGIGWAKHLGPIEIWERLCYDAVRLRYSQGRIQNPAQIFKESI